MFLLVTFQKYADLWEKYKRLQNEKQNKCVISWRPKELCHSAIQSRAELGMRVTSVEKNNLKICKNVHFYNWNHVYFHIWLCSKEANDVFTTRDVSTALLRRKYLPQVISRIQTDTFHIFKYWCIIRNNVVHRCDESEGQE